MDIEERRLWDYIKHNYNLNLRITKQNNSYTTLNNYIKKNNKDRNLRKFIKAFINLDINDTHLTNREIENKINKSFEDDDNESSSSSSEEEEYEYDNDKLPSALGDFGEVEDMVNSYVLRKNYNRFCCYLIQTVLKEMLNSYRNDRELVLYPIGYPMKSLIFYIVNAILMSLKRDKENILAKISLNESQLFKLRTFLNDHKTSQNLYCNYGCELVSTNQRHEYEKFSDITGIEYKKLNKRSFNFDELANEMSLKSEGVIDLPIGMKRQDVFTYLFCWQKTYLNFGNVVSYDISDRYKFYDGFNETDTVMKMYENIEYYTFDFNDFTELCFQDKFEYDLRSQLYMFKLETGYLMTFMPYETNFGNNLEQILKFTYDDTTTLLEKMKKRPNTGHLIIPKLECKNSHSEFQHFFANTKLYEVMNGKKGSAIPHNDFNLNVNCDLEDIPDSQNKRPRKKDDLSRLVVINKPFIYFVFGGDLSISYIGLFH